MRAGDSETAQAGVRMLMNGTTALKYGREGKPHATDFRLTEDGMTLTWKGKRSSVVGKLAAAKESKSVELRFVAHFLVGRESAVFKRFQDGFHKATALGDNWSNEVVEDSVEEQKIARRRAPGKEHLSLSLQFARSANKGSRDTLDLSFEDEVRTLRSAAACCCLLLLAAACSCLLAAAPPLRDAHFQGL